MNMKNSSEEKINKIEENNISNENNNHKKSNITKIVFILIALVIVIGCYLAVTNLNSKDEEKTKDDIKEEVKEENNVHVPDIEEVPDEDDSNIDTEIEVNDENDEIELDIDDGLTYEKYKDYGFKIQSSDNKQEKKAILTAAELYAYSSSAVFGHEFKYGKTVSIDGMDLVEIINFEEVNAKFTKDNLVARIPGGSYRSFVDNDEIIKKDGKYYEISADRGTNIFYQGTRLRLVSFNDNEIKMTAISIYEDYMEEPSLIYTESYDFVVQKEDGEWKIDRFTTTN